METKKISGWIDAAEQEYGMPPEQLVAQCKTFDILKKNPTLKQVGDTAAFLASETGVALNSHSCKSGLRQAENFITHILVH